MSVEVKNLSFSYGERTVLEEISFSASDGDVLAVLGPNGAGKSTLFRCVLGFLRQWSGVIRIDGESVRDMDRRRLAGKIAYIPQSSAPVFNHSVLEVVLMGLTNKVGLLRSPGKEHMAAALEALRTLGIEHLKDRGYAMLSGGERQLVTLARALAQNTRALVLDEPTANLDYGRQHKILSGVRSLADDGYTVILSTHNPDHVFQYATRVVVLLDCGTLADGSPDEVLTPELIRRVYDMNVSMQTLQSGEERYKVCLPKRSERR